MKIKLILAVGLLMVLNMTFIYGKEFDPVQDIADMNKLEKYLKTAEIFEVEIDKYEGRTAPWGVVLNDGEIYRQAIFKYVNRPRPTHLPDSYHYEIAAYKVSKLMEYPVVPPVVEREIKETLGSLHLFLEGCFSLGQQQRRGIEPTDSQEFSDALSELAVFENLVFCERDSEDIYIQESDWKVWHVDFSEAFAPIAELNSEAAITRCSKEFFHNLQRLEASEIKKVLQPHLNDEEIDALLKRTDLVIDKIKQLIEEKGEDAVLF
ncbi:MAG: hypothetical protein WBE11_10270 [Candidatus Aminicenantaceae bacterium]